MAVRDDPSRATRAELEARSAESVALVGSLARLVGKAASSPALASTVASFADYEVTIQSTQDMLSKVKQGLVDLEETLDDCEASAHVFPRRICKCMALDRALEYRLLRRQSVGL